MVSAEFEEKEFEGPLYNQLERKTNLLWSPGQCFEKYLGIDRAINISDHELWKVFGYDNPLCGVSLPFYNWDFIWNIRKKKKKLPSFKLNVFIQAKRPYYGNTPKKLNKFGVIGKCFRFDITEHQQKALEKVAETINKRALMIYASPLFITNAQLYKHTKNNSMVENSTFPEISNMKGHKSWYYSTSKGIACSEPKEINYKSIIERLEAYVQDNEPGYEDDERYYLKSLANSIVKALSSDDIPDMAESALFFDRINEINNFYKYYDFDNELKEIFISFNTIRIFTQIFNLDWFVLG
ncbi:hypothetical protein [Clostridium tagluense]|uniref:hypothetical protein n=1 Tax=Clostridium tagluense TaxID=360422 RepID=UPI001CF2B84A|nr:hypothetical protein [Clostridium tagluense]MCB2300571.1 hypothetical protein [Clostridium tagluense]